LFSTEVYVLIQHFVATSLIGHAGILSILNATGESAIIRYP
jgi:hypothetical protein